MFAPALVLARGCASRLLVLSATGNLRALLSGLVFAVTAQAALRGVLSPLRDRLAGAWTLDDPGLMTIALLGLERSGALAIGLVWLAAGILYAVKSRLSPSEWAGALGVGAAVAAWAFTDGLAGRALTRRRCTASPSPAPRRAP